MRAITAGGYTYAYHETLYRLNQDWRKQKPYWLAVLAALVVGFVIWMFPNKVEDGVINPASPQPGIQSEELTPLPISPFDFLV
jgi:uncharacterized membrane-anchored protein